MSNACGTENMKNISAWAETFPKSCNMMKILLLLRGKKSSWGLSNTGRGFLRDYEMLVLWDTKMLIWQGPEKSALHLSCSEQTRQEISKSSPQST